MRSTIDLPENLNRVIKDLAEQQNQSRSQIISKLLHKALNLGSKNISVSENGLPTVSVGRVIDNEYVRSLEDDI